MTKYPKTKFRWGHRAFARDDLIVLQTFRGVIQITLHVATLLTTLSVLLFSHSPGHAQQLSEAEEWALTELRAGREANLNQHCSTSDLDAGANGDPRWETRTRTRRTGSVLVPQLVGTGPLFYTTALSTAG